jgi:hypothetical protein
MWTRTIVESHFLNSYTPDHIIVTMTLDTIVAFVIALVALLDVNACDVTWRTPLKFQCAPKNTSSQSCFSIYDYDVSLVSVILFNCEPLVDLIKYSLGSWTN